MNIPREPFKSRRDRTKPIEISLEKAEQKATPPGSRASFLADMSHKKMLGCAAVVLILAVIGVIALVSGWQAQADSLTRRVKASKGAAVSSVETLSGLYKEAKDKPALLKQTAAQLRSIECGASAPYQPLVSALQNCQKLNESSRKVSASLRRVAELVSYDHSVTPLFKTAISVNDDTAASKADTLKAWQSLQKSLKKVAPPEELTKAHLTLRKQITVLVRGWEALVAADTAQKKKEFTNAQAQLGKMYTDIRKQAATFKAVYIAAQGDLLADFTTLKKP